MGAVAGSIGPHGGYHPIFAQRLAVAIRRRGIRKRALAQRLGFDPSLITYWLKKGGEPRFAVLVDLAGALNTTPHFLLGWPEGKAQ